MRFESEVITEEVLPAIRSIMASQLRKEYGLKQKEIADKMGITQPAVSQYLTGNRANHSIVEKLKKDPQIEITLRDAVAKAAQDRDFSTEISQTVQTARDKGILQEQFKDTEKIN
ncbi:MAG: transcriptional regulator [Candidatus Nanohalobium sp.]